MLRSVVGALALAFLASPAFAQEPKPPPVCQYYMDETVADLTSKGYFLTMISTANMPTLLKGLELAGQLPPGVITRAFVVNFAGTLKVGIEADGCLLPPLNMALGTPAPASLRQSGRTPYGTFA